MASDKKNPNSGPGASSLFPGRDPNEPVLELDLQQEPEEPTYARIDELEFDPVAESRRSLWEGDEGATELELPASVPPGVMEPLPDPDKEPLQSPVPTWEAEPAQPAESAQPIGTSAVSLGAESIPDLTTQVERPSRAVVLRAPAAPQAQVTPGGSRGAQGVPDLLVADRRKSPAVRKEQERRSQNPPPVLDLDYGSSPHPEERAYRRSSIPAASSSAGIPTDRASQYPGGLASPSRHPSQPPPLQVGQWGGLMGEAELGGVDDFDLTGTGRSAQLDVGVALPKQDDDQPWPLGCTPFADELEVSMDAVACEGYGKPPSAWTGTPVYALRLFLRKGSVENRARVAEASLRDQEQRRDRRLSVLAEQTRATIGGQERFAPLFAQVDQLTEQLELNTRELESLDRSSAHEMHAIEKELDEKKARRLRAEAERDAMRQAHDEQERQIERLRVLQKRVAIEERNLDDRLEAGGISNSEYELARAEVQSRLRVLENQQNEQRRQLSVTAARLVEKENSLRVALADQQNKEGALETHLIAIEGENVLRSERLMETRRARIQVLADIGRAILELRGAVSVDVPTRRELIALDAEVSEAARRVRLMELVKQTVDRRAQRLGLALGVSLVVLFVGGLVYLLSRSA